jgi:hypothetical protein
VSALVLIGATIWWKLADLHLRVTKPRRPHHGIHRGFYRGL